MRWSWKLAASFATAAAFAVIAVAGAPAANPHQKYTCVKENPNGHEVQVDVPEPAVGGLTNAGFTCVPNPPDGGGEDPGNEDPGNEDPGNEDPGNEDPGDEDPGNEDPGNEGSGDSSGPGSGSSAPAASEGQRAVFCSTNGPAFRANGDGMGIALDLLDEQGALLVERGLATPAIYYQGVGASCDVLPGYAYAGAWVGHMGDIVPGVAVYPLFVRASVG